MLDKTIPYFNVIMKRDLKSDSPNAFGRWDKPTSFVRTYRPGDAENWIRIQREAGEFLDTPEEEVRRYFAETYESRPELLRERGLFALDETGRAVGTCFAWKEADAANTASLHWLAVSEAAQGKGIGTALVRAALGLYAAHGESPVFLHTQPWSYQAVSLYLHAGFRFCRQEAFLSYRNENEKAIPILKRYIRIPEDCWA